jgi:hypothetical protein
MNSNNSFNAEVLIENIDDILLDLANALGDCNLERLSTCKNHLFMSLMSERCFSDCLGGMLDSMCDISPITIDLFQNSKSVSWSIKTASDWLGYGDLPHCKQNIKETILLLQHCKSLCYLVQTRADKRMFQAANNHYRNMFVALSRHREDGAR